MFAPSVVLKSRSPGIGSNIVRGRGERHDGVVVKERDVAGAAIADREEAGPERRDHHRLDHREGEEGRHRGVDGVAAPQERLDAGHGCERMVGGDDGARRHDLLLVGLAVR